MDVYLYFCSSNVNNIVREHNKIRRHFQPNTIINPILNDLSKPKQLKLNILNFLSYCSCDSIVLDTAQVDATLEQDVSPLTPSSAPRVTDDLFQRQGNWDFCYRLKCKIKHSSTYPVVETGRASVADNGNGVITKNIRSAIGLGVDTAPENCCIDSSVILKIIFI